MYNQLSDQTVHHSAVPDLPDHDQNRPMGSAASHAAWFDTSRIQFQSIQGSLRRVQVCTPELKPSEVKQRGTNRLTVQSRNDLQEGKKTFEKDLRPLIMALLAQEKIKYAKKQTAASRSFQDSLTWIENATDTKQYIASAMKVLEEELKRQDQRNSNRSNEPPLTVDTQIATDTTTTPSSATVETQQSLCSWSLRDKRRANCACARTVMVIVFSLRGRIKFEWLFHFILNCTALRWNDY